MSETPTPADPPRERLHKFLARAGVGSRRTCEEFVRQGRVQVAGEVVRVLGTQIDPEKDEVRFDGEVVRAERPAYFLAYKPAGVVCTTRDQFQRTSVVDLVRDRRGRRLFPVGRLEEDSEGLILVTNDGGLAHHMADYRRPIRHTYFVKVRGRVSQESLAQVRAGVWLSDGRTSPMHVKVQRAGKKVTTLLVTPAAYQHRQLRRAMAKAGLHVDQVVRVRIGFLTTHGLKKGSARLLAPEEVQRLLDPRAEDTGPPVKGPVRRQRPGDRRARRSAQRPAPRKKSTRGGAAVRQRKQQAARRRNDAGPARRVIGP